MKFQLKERKSKQKDLVLLHDLIANDDTGYQFIKTILEKKANIMPTDERFRYIHSDKRKHPRKH